MLRFKTKPRTERTRKNSKAAAERPEAEESKDILKRQAKLIEEQVTKVKKTANSRVTKIFRMKEIVAGNKKPAQEAQAIKDPESGQLVVSNSEIKKVTLKYCLKTLENNKPEKEVEELVELKNEVHKLRMEDKTHDKEYRITDEDFFMVIWKFDLKKSTTYEFITRAGLKFQLAILKLCRRFIKNESFPSRFNLTTLVQLPKKGSAQDLDNKRFIHLKEWLARLI